MAKNPLGGLGNIAGILKQAQKMKENLEIAQRELADKTIETSAGGGMVTVKLNGRQELLAVSINPEILQADDKEMIEDLVVAAVNEGIRRSQEMLKEEMSKLTGGLSLPGLFP